MFSRSLGFRIRPVTPATRLASSSQNPGMQLSPPVGAVPGAGGVLDSFPSLGGVRWRSTRAPYMRLPSDSLCTYTLPLHERAVQRAFVNSHGGLR